MAAPSRADVTGCAASSPDPREPASAPRVTIRRIDVEEDPIGDDDLTSAFSFHHLDASRLLDRRVLHVIAGIAVAALVVAWPERTDRILGRLIGTGLALSFASFGWSSLRRSPAAWAGALLGAAGTALGGFILLFPDRSIVTVGRLAALALAIGASLDLLRQLRLPAEERAWAWPAAKAMAGLAIAAIVATYPSELLALATGVVALGWALLGAVAVSQSISTRNDRTWRYQESGDLVVAWLDRRPKEADDRRELYEKVLYEGPRLRLRVIRFLALMTFASVIGSMGVITDSTAVVIGAMLIAPLMTPLMGVAISVVMGWPNRLTRNASIALAGVALAITIGVILGVVAPTVIDTATNSQIISRSEPTILDLITAVAAGAAGAYGLSRPDVSDSLPGVAIAISLVPPLSVVGIAYSQGAWADGHGALLLFTTNALAIVVVGGITFVLTGVTPVRRVAGNQQRVRTATASIVALGAIVIGALSLNAAEIATNQFESTSVDAALAEWASDGEEFVFVRSDIDGDRVDVVLLGPSAGRPPAEELHAIVIRELGRSATVRVRLIVEEVAEFPDAD